jgi:hypothetical protein
MTVRFADPGSDADQIIEDLIQANSAPRRLTVVSSDHRLHRAARRRRAKVIDSDQWYAQVLRLRIQRAQAGPAGFKPDELQSEVEVRFWLRQFGLDPNEQIEAEKQQPGSNPFPPGFGEDLDEP